MTSAKIRRLLREFWPLLAIVLLVWGASQAAQRWQSRGQADSLRAALLPACSALYSLHSSIRESFSPKKKPLNRRPHKKPKRRKSKLQL